MQQPPRAKEWTWLTNFTTAIKMADSLGKRATLPDNSGFNLPTGVDPLPDTEKYQTTVCHLFVLFSSLYCNL